MEKTIQKFQSDYKYNPSLSKSEQQEMAASMHQNMLIMLKKQFEEIIAQDPDWAQYTYLDTRYSQREEIEGYQVSDVRVVMQKEEVSKTITFEAVQVGGRWFLWEDLRLMQ